jgi:hypothetical protein
MVLCCTKPFPRPYQRRDEEVEPTRAQVMLAPFPIHSSDVTRMQQLNINIMQYAVYCLLCYVLCCRLGFLRVQLDQA